MEEFYHDYKDPAKVAFFKRIPDQLSIFQKVRDRNKESISLLQLDEKHRRAIFKAEYDNFTLLNENGR